MSPSVSSTYQTCVTESARFIKFQIFRFKIQLKPSSRLERLSHNSRLQTVKLLLYLEMLNEATKYVNV